MIEPRSVCLYIPAGLKAFKLDLFNRIGKHIEGLGGRVIRDDWQAMAKLPPEVLPIVGCMPEFTPIIKQWRATGRRWIYWDRGYARRVFATCLPTGEEGGYYRWHLNGFQMTKLRKVPSDRWLALNQAVTPWREIANGSRGHIVIAPGSRSYARFHDCRDWIADTIDALARVTDRQLVIRDKEQYRRRPVQADIQGAHALVTHASNVAVESVILGCPVFVHPDSAAALVGRTDLAQIEKPVYPERGPWLASLAYCQFNERELVDGTLWKLIE
jgi:hypothetical protein